MGTKLEKYYHTAKTCLFRTALCRPLSRGLWRGPQDYYATEHPSPPVLATTMNRFSLFELFRVNRELISQSDRLALPQCSSAPSALIETLTTLF